MKAVKKLQNLHVKIHGEVKRKEMTDLNFRYKDGLVKKLWPITSKNPIFIICCCYKETFKSVKNDRR